MGHGQRRARHHPDLGMVVLRRRARMSLGTDGLGRCSVGSEPLVREKSPGYHHLEGPRPQVLGAVCSGTSDRELPDQTAGSETMLPLGMHELSRLLRHPLGLGQLRMKDTAAPAYLQTRMSDQSSKAQGLRRSRWDISMCHLFARGSAAPSSHSLYRHFQRMETTLRCARRSRQTQTASTDRQQRVSLVWGVL